MPRASRAITSDSLVDTPGTVGDSELSRKVTGGSTFNQQQSSAQNQGYAHGVAKSKKQIRSKSYAIHQLKVVDLSAQLILQPAKSLTLQAALHLDRLVRLKLCNVAHCFRWPLDPTEQAYAVVKDEAQGHHRPGRVALQDVVVLVR